MSEPTESNEDSQALAHRLAVSARGAASALASATTEAKDQAPEVLGFKADRAGWNPTSTKANAILPKQSLA